MPAPPEGVDQRLAERHHARDPESDARAGDAEGQAEAVREVALHEQDGGRPSAVATPTAVTPPNAR